ncbi:MAG: primosomal protein N' [Lentisphaeria bacterium]|nr:primosomal protein N' [Lentisphaeria bacterium]
MAVARVITDLALDREFDYEIPQRLAGRLRPGCRVRVPFGTTHRLGFVVGIKEHSDFPRLKAILGIEGEREQIPASLLRLADWIAEYYCCPREHAVRAVLPAVVRCGRMRPKRQRFACLPQKQTHDAAAIGRLTPKQQSVLEHLRRLGAAPVPELCAAARAGPSVVQRLERCGFLVIEERAVGRDPFAEDVILPSKPLALSAEQSRALERIEASIRARDGAVILLHGVTGSGKTEVYLQAIEECLTRGRDAIVLVPEISLTPQTCESFRARFGEQVSVQHSGLSDGERFDEWTRMREGKSHIVVGARSALFAPFANVGLIVVDEEHENTYKQEESPRYHARDVAVVRGKLDQATVVLGSATPSLESYYNAGRGKYQLATLTRRVDSRSMPVMELVDMRAEAAARGHSQIFSRRLESLVEDRRGRGEQTILFLNRRGYATQFLCGHCGFVAACADCSTTYTYHRKDRTLCCHLCGHIEPAPETCPVCGDANVRYLGTGTEKVEAAAHALFPGASIGRMDSDTMTTRRSYQDTLQAFRAGRIHVLIGTQMIAKGLHFPNCTLVGVLFADMGLHMPDFRAPERTFQLLTQVAGRSGRGEQEGHVVVQTYTPYHPALQHALNHDFLTFYGEEIADRIALGFPPAAHMIMVHFRGPDEPATARAATTFAARLTPRLPRGTVVAGPMPAPIAKMRGQFRYLLSLRGGAVRGLLRLLRPLTVGARFPDHVEAYVDVDPRSLL